MTEYDDSDDAARIGFFLSTGGMIPLKLKATPDGLALAVYLSGKAQDGFLDSLNLADEELRKALLIDLQSVFRLGVFVGQEVGHDPGQLEHFSDLIFKRHASS